MHWKPVITTEAHVALSKNINKAGNEEQGCCKCLIRATQFAPGWRCVYVRHHHRWAITVSEFQTQVRLLLSWEFYKYSKKQSLHWKKLGFWLGRIGKSQNKVKWRWNWPRLQSKSGCQAGAASTPRTQPGAVCMARCCLASALPSNRSARRPLVRKKSDENETLLKYEEIINITKKLTSFAGDAGKLYRWKRQTLKGFKSAAHRCFPHRVFSQNHRIPSESQLVCPKPAERSCAWITPSSTASYACRNCSYLRGPLPRADCTDLLSNSLPQNPTTPSFLFIKWAIASTDNANWEKRSAFPSPPPTRPSCVRHPGPSVLS